MSEWNPEPPTPSGEVPIAGRCDARFAAVRDAFRENFASEGELGAALAVRVGGRTVVDLWGGWSDAALMRPWREHTVVNAYSVGKGIVALLALCHVGEGAIDLDARVASYWPEFAAAGKDRLNVRSLLAHRSGLPAVRERLPEDTMYDWERMCGALAAQQPYWEPDTDHGYHVNTFGFLVGEVLRRATGLDVGEALRRTLTGPLDADFHFGLPTRRHADAAFVHAPQMVLTGESQWALAFPPTGDHEHDLMIWHAYFNPPGASGMGKVNTESWRAAAIPSTNGHGTARGVAAIYAAALSSSAPGPPRDVLAEGTRVHSEGPDRVLGRDSRFGLGFQLPMPDRKLGPSPRAFGHFGYGGSLGFADPDSGLAFGYLMNRPGRRWQTPRTQRLIDAVYDCLG